MKNNIDMDGHLKESYYNLKIDELKVDIDKIFLISDIHFGLRNSNLEWFDLQKDYFYNWFLPLVKKYKTKKSALFVLGDLFENRLTLNIKILNEVLKIFDDISEILPIYLIPGNHDIYFKSTLEINSLNVFKYASNVNLILNPIILKIGNNGSTGLKILILPWQTDTEERNKILKTTGSKADYIFCHDTISGVSFFNSDLIGQSNLMTNVMQEHYEKDLMIDLQLVKKVKKIFSGHIHLRQEYQNVIYIGSPYQITRADIDNTKGIYVLSLNRSKNEFDIEFFENKFSPIFLKLYLHQILDMTVDEFCKLIKNNFVDFYLTKDFNNYLSFNQLLDLTKTARRIQFQIIDLNMQDLQNFYFNEAFSYDDLKQFQTDLKTQFKNYLKQLKYSKEVKQYLYKKLMNLYEQAILKG